MTCTVQGCKNKIVHRGMCRKHGYPKDPVKSVKSSSKPDISVKQSTQSQDDIINAILGGKPVETPPDVPKDPATGKDIPPQKPGSPGPGMAMSIPPSFFKMMGAMLAKVTDTQEFKLDDECAEYLSDCLREAMASKGVKADPMMMFAIAMVMWFGMGIAAFVWKRFGAEKFGEGEGLLAQIFGKKEKKKEPPLVEAVPVQDQTVMVSTPPTVPTTTVNKDWKPLPVERMERMAERSMEKEISKTQARSQAGA